MAIGRRKWLTRLIEFASCEDDDKLLYTVKADRKQCTATLVSAFRSIYYNHPKQLGTSKLLPFLYSEISMFCQRSLQSHNTMSKDDDEQPSLASLKAYEWERRLYDAEGLDQTRSVTEKWRADESALDSDPDGTYFALPMMSTIRHGDIPLIKYLLEQEVPVDCTIGKCVVSDPPEEKSVKILELLYHHGWDVNQITPRGLSVYAYD